MSSQSIEHKAISALRWATVAKLVAQITSWAGTLVVVRLLSPHDYGLMAKVAVVCAIAGAISELGLEAAIVRTASVARLELQKLYGVALLFGASVTGIIIAAAPLFAKIFHEPRLTGPVIVASFQLMLGAIGIVSSAMWTRDLSFRQVAKIDMVVGVITTVVTVLLALHGDGVWALVLGTLVGSAIRTIALLTYGERVWPVFSFKGIGEHIKYGLTLVSSRVGYFVVIQSDVLIGSAFLSTTEIGQYSVALQLATLPMQKVMGTLNQITLPAVARQQEDPGRVRESVLKSLSVISLMAFPALWGISAVAPELVRVLFGEKWLAVIPALTILPLIVPLRMICSIIYTTSFALGNRRLEFRNTLANLICLPAGFFVGAHWGLIGLCAAWLISVPLSYSISMHAVLKRTGIRLIDLISECGAPALAAGVMYGAIVALRLVLANEPAIIALFTLVLAGAIAYFAVIALISVRHLERAKSFARSLFARGQPKAA